MAVRRVVPNLHAADPVALAAFYRDVFGLSVLMEMDFITTLGGEVQTTELSLASEGGSGTPLPEISVEVDDFAATLDRATKAGAIIEYGPVDEPWGVRRFFMRDPEGHLINVLTHNG